MHISFVVLVECNMKQMRIGTSYASIYRHKNRKDQFYHRHRLYVTSTIHLLSKLFILCSPAHKRYGLCDNQPLIVKLPKQYKNKEGVKISTKVFTRTIVLASELTP